MFNLQRGVACHRAEYKTWLTASEPFRPQYEFTSGGDSPTRSGNKRIAFCFKSTRRTDREQTSLAANDAHSRFLLHFTAESNLLSDFPLIYSALNQKDVSLSLFSSRLFFILSFGWGRREDEGGEDDGQRDRVKLREERDE